MTTQTTYVCDYCPIRKHAEEHPDTLKARMWRWHTSFCPMWNTYQERIAVERHPIESEMSSESTGPTLFARVIGFLALVAIIALVLHWWHHNRDA